MTPGRHVKGASDRRGKRLNTSSPIAALAQRELAAELRVDIGDAIETAGGIRHELRRRGTGPAARPSASTTRPASWHHRQGSPAPAVQNASAPT